MRVRIIATGRLFGFIPVRWTVDILTPNHDVAATLAEVLHGRRIGPLTLAVEVG